MSNIKWQMYWSNWWRLYPEWQVYHTIAEYTTGNIYDHYHYYFYFGPLQIKYKVDVVGR